MARSFAELKKASSANLQNLQKKLEESNKKGSFSKDERYWTPTKDDAGNALAVIRFLPAPQGEELPYVSYFDHSFQVNGRYYIEKSLTTYGEKDPLGEANKELWDSGLEENKKIASSRKRRTNYVANILVVKDSGKPENNGKVFLYRFGKKIFDKIKDKVQPEMDVETPVDVFDMFEGENFKLKVKKQGDFPNYDDSQFIGKSVVWDGDEEKMEATWLACHPLQPEVDKDRKSYDDLKKKLNWVLYGKDNGGKTAEDSVREQISSASSKSSDDDLPPFDVDDDKPAAKKAESKKDESSDFDLNLDDFNLEEDD